MDFTLGSLQLKVEIRSIGKGETALNDFWVVMNVSHRGLHHNMYQEHLKNVVSKWAAASAEKIYTESITAVKSICKDMDPSFTKDVAVVYDSMWHKRGFSSHVSVGSMIEFDTGLILDTKCSTICVSAARLDPRARRGSTPGGYNTTTAKRTLMQTWEREKLCRTCSFRAFFRKA